MEPYEFLLIEKTGCDVITITMSRFTEFQLGLGLGDIIWGLYEVGLFWYGCKVGVFVGKLYVACSKFGLFRLDTIWGLDQVRQTSRANIMGEYPSKHFKPVPHF